jgi:hypothetical protein
MSKQNQTITGGLGIKDEGYFDFSKERVLKKLKELDTISDVLEAVAECVRDDEFGEANLRVSDYEKKLILSGFIAGCVRAETEMSHKMEELKMLMHLMMMSKQVGTSKDGSPILGGMINGADLPKELRDFLERMSGEDKEGDDD